MVNQEYGKMKIKIVFFAHIREIMEMHTLTYELESNVDVTVAEVILWLKKEHPKFREYTEHATHLMSAINQQMCDLESLLKTGDELALFPPVTGG